MQQHSSLKHSLLTPTLSSGPGKAAHQGRAVTAIRAVSRYDVVQGLHADLEDTSIMTPCQDRQGRHSESHIRHTPL